MQLKGLYHTWRVREDQSRVYYYYAWKNGPRIHIGDRLPAVIADDHPVALAFRKAHDDAKPKRAEGFVSGLIADFRESSDFLGMAESTRYQWRRWLDRIEDEFGALELGGADMREFRGEVKTWRDKWKATPRQADYAVQVMVRVLAFGKEAGKLDFNRAAGLERLSKPNAHAELIWTEDDIKAACADPETPTVTAFVIRLAALTGLRRGDLAGLTWDEVEASEIVRETNKGRGSIIARIPILPETRILLDEIKAHWAGQTVQSTFVLAAPGGTQWNVSYMTQAVKAACDRSGIKRRLHDLRGTFVTRLVLAGLSDDRIAEIVGWSVKAVARMRRTYCSAAAIAKDNVRRLARKTRK